MSIPRTTVSMTINNKPVGPFEVPESLMMVHFLHEYVDLTGTKFGCGAGVCHACVVIVDNADGTTETHRSCITGVGFFNGKNIRTVEGHAKTNEKGEIIALSPVQDAFIKHFSFQCGYCTSGFVNQATVLVESLKKQPVAVADVESTIEEHLGEHICRCTGYIRYYQAMKQLIIDTPGLTK